MQSGRAVITPTPCLYIRQLKAPPSPYDNAFLVCFCRLYVLIFTFMLRALQSDGDLAYCPNIWAAEGFDFKI